MVILKYKKKKKEKKNPPKLPPLIRLGAGTSVRIHPGGAKKYHSPLAGHAELVANIM